MVTNTVSMPTCLWSPWRSVTPRFFGDLFAGLARNTAVSTSYSLGASFTAALAPMICHMSSTLFHTNFAICVPFMLVALMAVFILKKEMIYAKR